MEKIVKQSQIWDLHIHTPYKYDKSSNSYNNDDKDVFVQKMKKIIESSKNRIGMMSFTDHNHFDKDVYNKFKEATKDLGITLIPGIEVDLKINSNAVKPKHILFYFPESQDYDKIDSVVNKYLEENGNITFDDFVSFLVESGFRFAISPHAFKQKIRGIETEWNDDDDEKNAKRIKLFSAYFFVFWESDKSSIIKAKEYIDKYYDESQQAIANFSDSHDYDKFKSYLDSPSQYFRALNNFNGIMMVGTESSRISDEPEMLDENLGSQRIKKILINGKDIELSDRLNVIIGGRGKGKSILMDKIGYYFTCNSEIQKDVIGTRKTFLKKIDIKLKNFLDVDISDDVVIKFLNQSYIDKLFSDESSKKIETYFKDEFDSVIMEEGETVLLDVKTSLLDIQKKPSGNENVENIIESLKANIKIKVESTDAQSIINKLKLYYEDANGKKLDFYTYVSRCFPNEIIDDSFREKICELVLSAIKKISDYNLKELKTKGINQISYLVVKRTNESLDAKVKAKNQVINSIKKKLISLYEKEMYVINIINKIYSVNESVTKIKINYNAFDGCDGNKFYFIKYRNVEHPVEFAKRILISSINGKVIAKKDSLSNEELFKLLLMRDDIYNTDFSKDTVIDTIKKLVGIKAETKNKIIHHIAKEDKYLDLFVASPGMQTNSLMEYVLNQNSTIPLLIDQPEDNVDNESRYKFLTKWIKNMKYNRQIILVSHDANIVINGDAENIIIADCVNSEFTYDYGALEYDSNIERAATILDGGINAIRRRIQKYGD